MSASMTPQPRRVDWSPATRTAVKRVRGFGTARHPAGCGVSLRVVGLLTVLLAVLACATWAGVRVAHAGSDPAVVQGTSHVVQSGETLWGIAVDHYGSVEHDVRKLVDRIIAVNRLDSARIVPGDRLTLPFVE